MKSIVAFAVLALVGLAAAEITFGPCPDFDGLSGFSLADFRDGWFEIERIEVEWALNGECNTATFVTNDDGEIVVDHSFIIFPGEEAEEDETAQLVSLQAAAVLAHPDEVPLRGSFNVTLFGPTDFTNYHVIDTDYTSWAVVYNCKEILEDITDKNYWLLSRTPQLNPAALASVNAVKEALEIDPEWIRQTRQDDSCYEIEPINN